ncbi:YitT family protein [Granulosicoccaceae sp. 1_MG-2023]|nr:YitT family protein [Granulosicoccaceae sp. 1_MG-2023]
MPEKGEMHAARPHSRLEDAIAIVIGTLVVSLGLVMLKSVGALTGGTAGLAFLLHYYSGVSFGVVFFVINLPFYWLSLRRMGRAFTLKTLISVTLVSSMVDLHNVFFSVAIAQPAYAVLMGGILIGLGLLVLFRHKTSLGGLNILSLYLQDKHGISAGAFQMGVDTLIILLSLLIIPPLLLLYSVAGAVILNVIIAMNHRPFRYMA